MLFAVQPCRMDYIEKDAPLVVGEKVITSGLGGVYPKGLAVGRVVGSELDRSGLYQRAKIAPAADLRDLKYVFVVDMSNVHKGQD